MTAEEFEACALALEGVEAKPHFDRLAFRRRIIFATLAGDRRSANLLLTPAEQEHYCALYGDFLRPVDNQWGLRGWSFLHFDRLAFRRRIIFATLAGDRRSANLLLRPAEQEHYCALYGDFLRPVDNQWGLRGWSFLDFDKADARAVEGLLKAAWAAAG